jgi:soluble lytic murein transglycosylase-like protein
MRRDVLGLGVVLAVSGLAYGSSRSLSPAALSAAPVMSIAAVPLTAPVLAVAAPRPPARRIERRDNHGSIATFVEEAALRYGVPESLVAAVISVESEFNPRAVSHRGARGLMQLMPETAAVLGVRDAFDPRQNVDAGARHLRDLLDRFANDVSLALAAYNAGAQAVIKHRGIPPYPETRDFVTRVLGRVGRVVAPRTTAALAASAPRVRLARHASGDVRQPEVESAPEQAMVRVSLGEGVAMPGTPVPARAAPQPAAVVEPPAAPGALTRFEAP